jgi:hypothetical protein
MNFASNRPDPIFPNVITMIIDSTDPEDLSRLRALQAGFLHYSSVERMDGSLLQIRLYPSLAEELRDE